MENNTYFTLPANWFHVFSVQYDNQLAETASDGNSTMVNVMLPSHTDLMQGAGTALTNLCDFKRSWENPTSEQRWKKYSDLVLQ